MKSVVPDIAEQTLVERLRAATALLQEIASDRRLLDIVPESDRHRLHQAVAEVYNPDPIARRRMMKEAQAIGSLAAPSVGNSGPA